MEDTGILPGAAPSVPDGVTIGLPDRRPTDPRGHVDAAGPGGVVGWAVDRARPGEKVRLLIVHRGQVVAEGTTGLPRPDVVAAGAGTGLPGFVIDLPDELLRLPGVQLSVHEAATGRKLANSPVTLHGDPLSLTSDMRDLVSTLVRDEIRAATDPAELDAASAFVLEQLDRLVARRAALASDAAERQHAFLRLLEGRSLSDVLAGAARACLDRYETLHLPPEAAPEVSVVIPCYGQFAATHRCVDNILNHLPQAPIEIILVDDGSRDETVFAGAIFTGGILVHRLPRNEGFVGAVNAGARLARGRFVMVLNNDTSVRDGWLDALLATFARDPGVGVAGSVLLAPDGTLQECGGLVWRDGGAWNWGRGADASRPEYRYLREVDYVSGAAMMVPRSLWDQLGGFDPMFAPGYYEDTDLCFRARAAGRRVVVQPASRIVHDEGTTAGQDVAGGGMKRFQSINRRRFLRRWEAELRRHPTPRDGARTERDRGRPRALFVDTCVPTPDQDAGSNAAVSHMRALQRLGFRVCFVASDRLEHAQPYTAQLEQEGIRCFDAPSYQSVEEVIRREAADGFELVYLHRLDNAAQFTPLMRQRLPGARIVFSVADLHHLRLRRQAEIEGAAALTAKSSRLQELEIAAARAADAVIVHSRYEAERLREMAPEVPVTVVPWVVEPRPDPTPFEERAGLAFIGGFRHEPNVDAARFLVEEVMPLVWARAPAIDVILAGSNMPEAIRSLAGPRVRALGYVADLDDVLGRVRLTAAPLRYGAGLKGKVLSSLAAGVPCAMTTVAAEGMALPEALTALVGDTAEALASAIVTLHEQPARHQEAARLGVEWLAAACAASIVDQGLAEACGLAAAVCPTVDEPLPGSAVLARTARSRGGRKGVITMSGSANAPLIEEHMPVLGSDGGHVGTVDKVEDDRIKLTKQDDPDGSGQHHHFLPVSAVATVESGAVKLNMPTDRAKALATSTGGSGTSHGMGGMSAG